MFYKKRLHLVQAGAFACYSVKIRVIFGVRFEREKVDIKSKPTGKLKQANCILESFEYLSQMSSKFDHYGFQRTVSQSWSVFLDTV